MIITPIPQLKSIMDETKNKVIPQVVKAIDTVAIKFKKDTEIRKAA